MSPVKWGIIGTGNIANQFANDLALVEGDEHRVHSILCRNQQQGEIFQQNYNAPHLHLTIDPFLKDNLDAVYIATPHTLHYEQCMQCLENKIPVLCEKPATINSEQLEQIIELARINNTFFLEGMWIRFLPSIKKVLELIADEYIGPIISVKAALSFKAPYDPNSRYFNPDLGGGSLLDLGIYPVFLSTLLLGKPCGIKAVGAISTKGIDEACCILLDYPGKQYAVLESSLITESDVIAEIAGLKGRIKILSPWNEKPKGILVELYHNNEKIAFPCEWAGRGFQFEVAEMMACLKENKIESDGLPHNLSLQVMRIMDEVRSQLNIIYQKYE